MSLIRLLFILLLVPQASFANILAKAISSQCAIQQNQTANRYPSINSLTLRYLVKVSADGQALGPKRTFQARVTGFPGLSTVTIYQARRDHVDFTLSNESIPPIEREILFRVETKTFIQELGEHIASQDPGKSGILLQKKLGGSELELVSLPAGNTVTLNAPVRVANASGTVREVSFDEYALALLATPPESVKALKQLFTQGFSGKILHNNSPIKITAEDKRRIDYFVDSTIVVLDSIPKNSSGILATNLRRFQEKGSRIIFGTQNIGIHGLVTAAPQQFFNAKVMEEGFPSGPRVTFIFDLGINSAVLAHESVHITQFSKKTLQTIDREIGQIIAGGVQLAPAEVTTLRRYAMELPAYIRTDNILRNSVSSPEAKASAQTFLKQFKRVYFGPLDAMLRNRGTKAASQKATQVRQFIDKFSPPGDAPYSINFLRQI